MPNKYSINVWYLPQNKDRKLETTIVSCR